MAHPRRELPLFPLENVVLLPDVQAPLHIFEPRYRQMMEFALGADRTLGMVAVVPERQHEMAGDPPFFPVGCAGFISRYERLADGRYHLILEGTERFRVLQELPREGERLFRIAQVEALEENPGPCDAPDPHALRQAVLELLEPLLVRAGREARVAVERLGALDDASFVNSLVISLGLPCEDKQVLLEAAGPAQRLERLEAVLRFHLAQLRAPAGEGSGRVH